jgi:rhodanese-related sulfurtransferase
MTTPYSFILQVPAAPAHEALQHFASKLAFESDPSDVHVDLQRKKSGFVVVDARGAEPFAERHVPGAINLPYRLIDEAAVAPFRNQVVVVYCWTAACNAADKAAVRLATLGVQVKQMVGGLSAWVEEGYPVEGTLAPEITFTEYLRFHHSGTPGPFRRL